MFFKQHFSLPATSHSISLSRGTTLFKRSNFSTWWAAPLSLHQLIDCCNLISILLVWYYSWQKNVNIEHQTKRMWVWGNSSKSSAPEVQKRVFRAFLNEWILCRFRCLVAAWFSIIGTLATTIVLFCDLAGHHFKILWCGIFNEG